MRFQISRLGVPRLSCGPSLKKKPSRFGIEQPASPPRGLRTLVHMIIEEMLIKETNKRRRRFNGGGISSRAFLGIGEIGHLVDFVRHRELLHQRRRLALILWRSNLPEPVEPIRPPEPLPPVRRASVSRRGPSADSRACRVSRRPGQACATAADTGSRGCLWVPSASKLRRGFAL